MELKVLVLLSIFFGSALGQSIQCTYRNTTIFGDIHYICDLAIQNPAGLDDFTAINGTHLAGRTNADVTGIFIVSGSRTINFPRILCSQFPNSVYIDFSFMDVVTIGENTLNGCRNVEWLRFWYNEIEEIHERAFANNSRLNYLDLDNNELRTLPENVFNGLSSLEELELSNNQFTVIPGGLFRPVPTLRLLLLISCGINELNQDWFVPLSNLEVLSIYGNNITSLPNNAFSFLRNLQALEISRNPIGNNLPASIFRDLTNLVSLYMANIRTTEINPDWFDGISNLEFLFIYSNLFISIPEGTFDRLTSLLAIDIGDNRLTESAIPGNLFQNMPNLIYFICDYNLLQNPNPQWFERMTELIVANFNFNQIIELPEGLFAAFRAIVEIDLWGNNIKTVNRNAFGNLGSLAYMDFDGNVINAVDERFLLEAWPLTNLFFWNNLCASDWFFNFGINREQFMPRMAICTRNFEFIVETATERGQAYRFYTAPSPGIQIRVNTEDEIRIALTPLNFLWNPSVEIIIGARNNTVSTIIRNQDEEVAVARSPNIIRPGQWTGFRVTWANDVILVTREAQNFPFLAYNLQDIYPITFYGLRSPYKMGIKNLVILFLIVGSSLGQQIACTYYNYYRDGRYVYSCHLSLFDPEGFDNFTSIPGTHLPGRTDADVMLIEREYGLESPIIPKILCSQFENIYEIDLNFISIERILEDSLRNCLNLEILWLMSNRIDYIHEQAFAHTTKLQYLILEGNRMTNISENIFDNLVNLLELNISYNNFTTIPGGLFKGLVNLDILLMEGLNINTLNPEWFENFANLGGLVISNNNLTALPDDIFDNMKNLWGLDVSSNPIGDNIGSEVFKGMAKMEALLIGRIGMTVLHPDLFKPLIKLNYLYIRGNLLSAIPEGCFDSLVNVRELDMGATMLPGPNIPGHLFDKLSKLLVLYMDSNHIQNINPQWFQNLNQLSELYLSRNQITELPIGVFVPIANLRIINFNSNQVKVISRKSFGNIRNMASFTFENNLINAIDERFLREQYNLYYLYLRNNICISQSIYMFGPQYLPLFEKCINNFNLIVETSTEIGDPYSFYAAPSPGIQLSVNTDQEIRIALTSFNILWNSSIEIIIGTRNNTVSTIIRNQDQEVAVARSPNIIRPGQWTGLRITWANDFILVTEVGQNFPFLGFNLQDIFPIQFSGIRSPESHAVWRVHPVDWP
ncbi:protein artichoke-like [Chironomus tepperi]|uniref:protein artichoke-like n=1 Tax=Chironomus tepperi TaxID=113505 RepID=UPI00391EED8D